MLERGLVSAGELHDAFATMRPGLFRFPAVDEATLECRLTTWSEARAGLDVVGSVLRRCTYTC